MQEQTEIVDCDCRPLVIDGWSEPWQQDLAAKWWAETDCARKDPSQKRWTWRGYAWRVIDGQSRDNITHYLAEEGLIKDNRDCALHGPPIVFTPADVAYLDSLGVKR